MTTAFALRLSYAALCLSLLALALSIAANLLHFKLPGPAQVPVLTLSMIWPLAFYAVAIYRKKLGAGT